ncbi:LysR family transcriptional regulator [Neisseria sp. 83E34]|uniref:LysR family transcriptional regulator n=1 Tax=Neisseria sp. 83E34 TaxID=1692264 RepID=UPI0006CEA886|nr:LysR family transcriptional regulator [Neisseria sp. 83E34]KPN72317.1 LysR family transcriptional regulator [Neisseria sp. 83E34]
MAKPLPPLYALRAFERAVHLESFTLAAQELHITQSAVSKHIKTLENHFGCLLFIRKGHKLTVTNHGKILARDLQSAFKLIEGSCRSFEENRSVLRLKVPTSLMMSWLIDCLKEYKKLEKQPHIHASSVWMDTDFVDFSSEPFDCAILLSNGNFEAGISSIKLFDEWLVPICSPNILERDGSIDLDKHDVIQPSPDRRDWKRWQAATGYAKEIAGLPGQVFDTLAQAASAAAAGHGLGIGDLALCAKMIQAQQLAVPIKMAVQTGDAYYLVMPTDSRKESVIQKFADFLTGYIPDIRLVDSLINWYGK